MREEGAAPRRLLHLLSGLEVGGKERVVLDLALRARARGLDHRLLLFDTPFRDAARDFDPGEVPWELLPRGPGLDLAFARALARRVGELEPDVLHAHNDTAVVYAALAGLRLGRRSPRLVATFHSRPPHATRGARWLTRLAATRMDAVTAVAEDLARFLRQDGWVGRCATLWNGVSLARFTPEGDEDGWRERLGVAAGGALVLHVARLDPVKRQEDLLAAARRLGPRASFVLVGSGPLGERLRSMAADLENVRFVERVEDVAPLLRAADVFVLCSDSEGAPRVLLEALACGKPIVASDVGGCRGLLTGSDGELCGRLVPARRPGELAEAIGELLGDRELRERLGTRARARAAEFSDEREWAGYVGVWGGER
ncbi:MAG TPA: glycosyltransferase [Planctomycetota bacterium]